MACNAGCIAAKSSHDPATRSAECTCLALASSATGPWQGSGRAKTKFKVKTKFKSRTGNMGHATAGAHVEETQGREAQHARPAGSARFAPPVARWRGGAAALRRLPAGDWCHSRASAIPKWFVALKPAGSSTVSHAPDDRWTRPAGTRPGCGGAHLASAFGVLLAGQRLLTLCVRVGEARRGRGRVGVSFACRHKARAGKAFCVSKRR